eukprot:scaffold669_cov152-Isochrysis_galbana.AAC.6
MAARVKSISATPIHTVPELDGFIKAFKLFNFQGDGHRKHPGHHGAAGNEDVRKCRTHHEGSGEKVRHGTKHLPTPVPYFCKLTLARARRVNCLGSSITSIRT